jgi:hypothetical protein
MALSAGPASAACVVGMSTPTEFGSVRKLVMSCIGHMRGNTSSAVRGGGLNPRVTGRRGWSKAPGCIIISAKRRAFQW